MRNRDQRKEKATGDTVTFQAKVREQPKTLDVILTEAASNVKLSFTEKMEQAKAAYVGYRQAGGTMIALDWLWDYDHDLFGELQSRWRFQSSYTAVTGGVMFCPKPLRRRQR